MAFQVERANEGERFQKRCWSPAFSSTGRSMLQS